jgi:hypothetical protein
MKLAAMDKNCKNGEEIHRKLAEFKLRLKNSAPLPPRPQGNMAAAPLASELGRAAEDDPEDEEEQEPMGDDDDSPSLAP